MIVYAVSAGTSVTALFLGGVGPGILMGLIMVFYNFLISKKRGYKGTPRGGGFLWVLKQGLEGSSRAAHARHRARSGIYSVLPRRRSPPCSALSTR